MSVYLIGALAVGTLFMMAIMFVSRRWVSISKAKTALFSVLLTVCGFVSVKIMYFIENGTWKGLSFFGAVFFIPLLLLAVARLMKEPWPVLLDLSAPSICVMLAIMKLDCMRAGCCRGMLLYYDVAASKAHYFPSRPVELVNALVVMAALLFLIRRKKNVGQIYPLFMVLYGVTRFIWNLFRDTEPFIWILPAGNFWSLLSLVLGVVWLLVLRKKSAS